MTWPRLPVLCFCPYCSVLIERHEPVWVHVIIIRSLPGKTAEGVWPGALFWEDKWSPIVRDEGRARQWKEAVTGQQRRLGTHRKERHRPARERCLHPAFFRETEMPQQAEVGEDAPGQSASRLCKAILRTAMLGKVVNGFFPFCPGEATDYKGIGLSLELVI